jgi:REP element-mobilizing transposase RayT
MPGHTFSSIFLHLTWSTVARNPCLSIPIKHRLYPYLKRIIEGEGAVPLKISGAADHIHVLVEIRPDMTVSELARKMKASSSKWMNKTFPELNFAWQEGYAVFSVSRSGIQDVERYIEQQEEHHRIKTFQEEYLAFLKKCGIEFDERFIWD